MTGKELVSIVKSTLPYMSMKDLQKTEEEISRIYTLNREEAWRMQKAAEGKLTDKRLRPIDLSRVRKPGKSSQPQVIELGHYPADRDGKKAPIRWQILGASKGKLLLLSEDILDVHGLQKQIVSSLCWEDASLRFWLNDEFLKRAFKEKDLQRIAPISEPVSEHDEAGSSTGDRVFLLNEEEAAALVDPLTAYTTEYCSKRLFNSWMAKCGWWLRSDVRKGRAKLIDEHGLVTDKPCNSASVGIRPAIWLKKD